MQSNIYKGVNLGGWLVLEKWITPSLYSNFKANDEVTLSIEDTNYKARINNHYEIFINNTDIKKLADNNINSVRIPISYWNFFPHSNFINSELYLDKIIKELQKYNISFILDIHAAPGGQNKHDHSGKVNECDFDKDTKNIKILLQLIEYLLSKYKKNLIGIELLNEPDSKLNRKFLYSYYMHANELIYSFNKNILTIISDEFRPYKIKEDLKKLNLKNIAVDLHLYQCFSYFDILLSFEKHIIKTEIEWKNLINDIKIDFPVIIGEWSLGLDNKTFKKYSEAEKEKALIMYAESQQNTFKHALGNYFWTYKTEDIGGWNFTNLIDKKIITI